MKNILNHSNKVDYTSLKNYTFRFGYYLAGAFLIELFLFKQKNGSGESDIGLAFLVIFILLPVNIVLWILNLTNFLRLLKNKKTVTRGLLYASTCFTFVMPIVFVYLA